MFHLEISFEMQHWIFTKLRHSLSKLTFSLFNLYVHILSSEKKECWQFLSDFIDIYCPKNIILVKDFNIVLDSKEKRGGNKGRDQMLPFVEEIV